MVEKEGEDPLSLWGKENWKGTFVENSDEGEDVDTNDLNPEKDEEEGGDMLKREESLSSSSFSFFRFFISCCFCLDRFRGRFNLFDRLLFLFFFFPFTKAMLEEFVVVDELALESVNRTSCL